MHPYLRDRGPSGEEALSAHTGVRLSRRTSGRAHIPLAGGRPANPRTGARRHRGLPTNPRLTRRLESALGGPSLRTPRRSLQRQRLSEVCGGAWAQPAPPLCSTRAAKPPWRRWWACGTPSAVLVPPRATWALLLAMFTEHGKHQLLERAAVVTAGEYLREPFRPASRGIAWCRRIAGTGLSTRRPISCPPIRPPPARPATRPASRGGAGGSRLAQPPKRGAQLDGDPRPGGASCEVRQ